MKPRAKPWKNILSDKFPIHNGLKQGFALLTLRLKFPLEYANRKD
jgi:hypothetical protein